MAATPNTFDYFLAAEPLRGLQGKSSTTAFDYFLGGEPLRSLNQVPVVTPPSAAPPGTRLLLLGVGP